MQHSKHLAFSLTIFLFLSVKAQNADEPLNSGAVLKQGSKLYDEAAYTKAINLYKTVSRNDTNYSLILHELAYASYMDSALEESMRYARQGLVAFPEKKADWYNLLGSSLDKMGKRKEALVFYDSLIILNPYNYLGWYNKGIAYLNLENYSEAKKCLEKELLIYPYHASAHYFLGYINVKEGKLVPAMLNFTTCLLMKPDGMYTTSCVTFLNNISKGTDDITEAVRKAKSGSDDDFELQQEIILSKVSMDKKYKLQTDLEDPITRQLQVLMEKLEYNEADPGFTMQFYVPFYTRLFKNEQFDLMVNYIFSGLTIKSVKSFVQKNDKKIVVFTNNANGYFSKLRTTQQLEFAARTDDNRKYYFNDASLVGIGKWHTNGKDEVLTGAWIFYHDNGQVKSKGNFNDNGEKNGDWDFYYDNGKPKQKNSYVNGKYEGRFTSWFTNGNISVQTSYKDNKLDGEYTSWYYNGLLQTVNHYVDDKKEGVEKNYTYDGFPDYTAVYKNDELEEKVIVYYNNGNVSLEKNYTNGKLNGAYKKYNAFNILTIDGFYEQGTPTGTWKEYYDSKALKNEYTYLNGEIDGLYKFYHENGKPAETLQYTKGKANGKDENFDEDGIKYSESIYENGRLRELSFFDKKGNSINTFTTRRGAGNLVFYNPEGGKDNEAYFNKDGYRDGKSIYYFASGKIKREAYYEEGSLEGERTTYFANGNISEIVNFTDDEEYGMLRTNHINGTKKFSGYFEYGDRQGEHISYNIFGTPEVSYYYLNNQQDGYTVYYSANGKKDFEEQYYQGWLKKTIQYDTLENVIAKSDFPDGSGELVYKHYNGKIFARSTYKNYLRQGKNESFYFDGSPRSLYYYKNGYEDSIARTYYYSGKTRAEGNYTLGKKTGEWKYYYESGALNYIENYVNTEEEGLETLYNEDGTKDKSITYKDGVLDGAYTIYGDNNEIAIQINYHDEVVTSYTYLGKDGKFVPSIPIKNGTALVTAYYKNGTKSAEINFENSDINGVHKIYNTSGNLYIDEQSVEGYNNGVRKVFYPGNKPAKEETYLYGNLHGISKTWYPNGNVKKEQTWYNGELNGTTKYFDESGKLKETRFYYYDQLLSVTKN